MQVLKARINLEAAIVEHPIDASNSCFMIDDFFENPDEIVNFAASSFDRFESPARSYPGRVLDLAPPACEEVRRFIRFRMNRLFAYSRSGLKTTSQLSLTTLQPRDFTWIQRLPHTDPRQDPSRRNFALLVYLFKDENLGGTGFYRLRNEAFWPGLVRGQLDDPNAGLSTVQARYPMFSEAPQYVTESNEAAELLTMVPAKFNRMICYSGDIPHSAYISDASLLRDDCATGRLTFNAFADVIPYKLADA